MSFRVDLEAAQRALREREELLRLATEAAGIGTFSLDARAMTVKSSATARRIFGFPAGMAPTASDWVGRVHPEDRHIVEATIRRSLETCDVVRYHFRILLDDGSVRWIETTAHMTFAEDERTPLTMYGAVCDVTERKRLEAERDQLLDSERAARAEAERANRMKDEFLAVMSHELRTPLNAVLGWTQMLRRGAVSPAQSGKALEAIERNAALLGRLIGDVLDVGRISAGKMRLDLAPTDLSGVIDAAIDTLRDAASARGIHVERAGEDAGAWVRGDPGRLQQIVWNLLTNAIKFSPPGGRVSIELCRDERRASIAVRDWGCGIRRELLPHLFEPFRQADVSSARMFGGLGLGLAIVHQLVELHGGAVRAESEGEGKGATFTVELPLVRRAEIAPGEERPLHRNGAARALFSGLRVLIVDDEPDARELTRRLLEEEGAVARAVPSPSDAMREVRAGWPDVLLSDLGMPGEDGFHLIRMVRNDERARSLPVIALTAFARAEDRARAEHAGFDAHVSKPIDSLRLFEALTRVTKTTSGV